jgi:paxillin
MEKQEAHSLTRALQEKDTREEARVYSAAQQEAAHLMWKHQNPHAPYANPDFDFRQHLRKGSHARSQSIDPFQELHVHKRGSSDVVDSPTGGSRNVSSGSNATTSTQSSGSRYGMSTNDSGVRHAHSGSLRERAIASFSLPMKKSRRSSGHRSSGHGSRKASDESSAAPFSNPEDRIYEEPEEAQEASHPQQQDSQLPLRAKSRNTSYGKVTQGTDLDTLAKPTTAPFSAPKPGLRYKNGIEVRGDDIRAATSMKLKDRSPRLPQPSVVSDRPGRPIISFEPNFYAKRADASSKPDQPAASPSGHIPSSMPLGSEKSNRSSSEALQGTVPQIQVEGIPSISISSEAEPEVETPAILVNGSDALPRNPRTSFDERAKNPPRFDLPREAREPLSKRSHWSPALANRRTQAQCASCALGIEGKIVSAAGERFHPECFTCYQCGELLECVAFYPEPEKARSERLQRHADQLAGQRVSGRSECVSDDGDPSLRFYCHLDFHEKFSPRCRNCKTPIEGKVIVACGGEWHEGHFFCAECGDPFDPTIPFVEKNGYAWCVPCHTRRFSGKCAGCRKPVTDMVINALGKEWHEACFCCRVGSKAEAQSFGDVANLIRNAALNSMMADSSFPRRVKARSV